MQDWMEQARKNGLAIQEVGHCQLCAAKLSRGLAECVEIAAEATHRMGHQQAVEHGILFLCVDAHALQHSEIHGRWNNHFHLTRLNLILKESIPWSYARSTRLSAVLDGYKIGREREIIVPPAIGRRGNLQVGDVLLAKTDPEYIRIVWEWATQVYRSYESGHAMAQAVARLFLKRSDAGGENPQAQ